MPSTSLCSVQLRQLATDSTPFYLMTAVVQIIFLFIYWIGIVAFARPQTCAPGTQSAPQQWVVTFVLLALFLVQATITVAATLCTFRGTPLEPSKRRWVTRLSWAYLSTLPINAGLLAYSAWVVLAGDGSCWSSGNTSMPATIVFGAIGVLVGQLVGWLVTWNSLCDVEAGNVWHALTRTGVSSLVHLCGTHGAEHRGPAPALEEMATQLQRLMAGIDGEKTDAAAGLVCAKLLQDEAVAAAAAAAAGPDEPGKGGGRAPDAVPLAAGSVSAVHRGKSSEHYAALRSEELLAWAAGVCRGAAAACPAACGSTAAAADVQDAERWARYATAAYGARQHLWRRGKRSGCAASKQLARLAAAAAAEKAQPLWGWGGLGGGLAGCGGRSKAASRAELRDFAAARELLGPGCQIIAFCSGNKGQGLLPHLVALDRATKAVVLGIAGDWQHPPAMPQVQPVPADWLAAARGSSAAAEAGLAQGLAVAGAADLCSLPAAEAAGGGAAPIGNKSRGKEGSSCGNVHSRSLAAAKALLGELERSKLLQRLLQPGAGQAEGMLAGVECSGWQLVVAGHGLGAGAACLLASRLQSWQLAPTTAWCYGPPGELSSGPLAATLSSCCTMTAVVVGDDFSPRISSAALLRLVDQCVVGLARLRYCKFGLLAALVCEALGPRRWQGRWSNPSRALRPLSEVPEEALSFLQRYRDWRELQSEQQQQQQLQAFPGRVLLLSRSGSGAAAGTPAPAADNGAGSSSSSSSSDGGEKTSRHSYQAGWLSGGDLAGFNIRVSAAAVKDHYVSRLLGVLGGLAVGSPAGTSGV